MTRKNGMLIEVSRNFFAMCKDTKDVFYFGEEVNMYEGQEVAGHDGTCRAGVSNAKAGLIMPGLPEVGMRYFLEVAPGVAMDRADIINLSETVKTPAGTFGKCLKTQEGSALKPKEKEFKTYAFGIGLFQDADILLVKHGTIQK